MTRTNGDQPASLIADVDSRVRAMQWMIRTLIVLLIAAFGVFWRINLLENQHTRELFTQQIALVQKDVQLVAKDVEYLRTGFGTGATLMSGRQLLVTDEHKDEMRSQWSDLFEGLSDEQVALVNRARGLQHKVTSRAQGQNLEDFCALAIDLFQDMGNHKAAEMVELYRADVRRAREDIRQLGGYNGEVTDPFSDLFEQLEYEPPDWYVLLASANGDDDEEDD